MAVRDVEAASATTDGGENRGDLHLPVRVSTGEQKDADRTHAAVQGDPLTDESRPVPQTAKTYRINEVFLSLQGEGMRAGTSNWFIRFSGCNMACSKTQGPRSPGGFDCDTEFVSGVEYSLEQLCNLMVAMQQPEQSDPGWIILTGGEPALQVDRIFCEFFHLKGYKLAIETNGSIELPYVLHVKGGDVGPTEKRYLIDWITVSPKVAEHCIRQLWANEVKYVRGFGQGVPRTVVRADHYLISPAFAGNELDPKVLQWCISLCLQCPKWRLSLQQHKAWGVR